MVQVQSKKKKEVVLKPPPSLVVKSYRATSVTILPNALDSDDGKANMDRKGGARGAYIVSGVANINLGQEASNTLPLDLSHNLVVHAQKTTNPGQKASNTLPPYLSHNLVVHAQKTTTTIKDILYMPRCLIIFITYIRSYQYRLKTDAMNALRKHLLLFSMFPNVGASM
jgi:hypothetical protein